MRLSPQKSLIEKTRDEGGFIAETFFGLLCSLIHYRDKDGNEKCINKKETFAEILINVIGFKDIYEAWETMY